MAALVSIFSPRSKETVESFGKALASEKGCNVKTSRIYDRLAMKNIKDGDGNTVLHLACRVSDLEVVQWALNMGAQAGLQNHADETPLVHLFTSKANLDPIDHLLPIVKALLLKMDQTALNARDQKQSTALHYAAKVAGSHLDIYRAIETAGGDPSLKDFAQQTPSSLLASAFASFMSGDDLDITLKTLRDSHEAKIKEKKYLELSLEQLKEISGQAKVLIEKLGDQHVANQDVAAEKYVAAEESGARAHQAKIEAAEAEKAAEIASQEAARLRKKSSRTERRKRSSAAIANLKESAAELEARRVREADEKRLSVQKQQLDRRVELDKAIELAKKEELAKTAELAAIRSRIQATEQDIDTEKEKLENRLRAGSELKSLVSVEKPRLSKLKTRMRKERKTRSTNFEDV